MPYISQVARQTVDAHGPTTPGELNYAITRLLVKYASYAHASIEDISYMTLNDMLGALEGAKLEFYRRIVVPYEDCAKLRNGDVYDDILTPHETLGKDQPNTMENSPTKLS